MQDSTQGASCEILPDTRRPCFDVFFVNLIQSTSRNRLRIVLSYTFLLNQSTATVLTKTGKHFCLSWPLKGFPSGSAGKEFTCNAGDLGWIPGLGRSPGERKGYLLQYFGLENSMDRIVHGVAKSRTQLSDFRFPQPYKPLQLFNSAATAPHSSTLAWKIPWAEEPGGLQSTGSLRVGHD